MYLPTWIINYITSENTRIKERDSEVVDKKKLMKERNNQTQEKLIRKKLRNSLFRKKHAGKREINT